MTDKMTDKKIQATGATADNAVADRRNFIKLAGATAAGAGATVATAAVAAVAPETLAKDALYQESAHVKRYYDSAR